jgi:hypothetical protein
MVFFHAARMNIGSSRTFRKMKWQSRDYRLVRRGAVVLTILQSPMITPGKTLPSK